MFRFLVRDAAWLTEARTVAVGRVLLLALVGLAASTPWTAPTMEFGHDFAAFWTAGRMALAGHAADAYGQAGRDAIAALFGPGTYAPFFYTPIGLLLWLPFALLPFKVATAVWVAASGLAYALAMRACLGGRVVVTALAFPAVAICAAYGQNGLFSAALFGAAALALERSPVLAGVLVGCLAYKPQLGVLAPLAFAAAGRWRAFLAAALTVAGLAAASAAAFGLDSWSAFVAALPAANAWNGGGVPGFSRFVSPYAGMRLLGAPAGLAWMVQAALAAAAAAALAALAWRRPGGAAEMAMLVAATGFCVPFLGDYDLVIFAVAGAWAAGEAVRTGWLPYERAVLGLLFMAPLAIKPVALAHHLPLAPVALAALAGLVLRRAWRARPSNAAAACLC